MLQAFEFLVEGRECFCLPFGHLTQFYGQGGFKCIPRESAPQHIRERLANNLSKGDKMLVMKRSADYF